MPNHAFVHFPDEHTEVVMVDEAPVKGTELKGSIRAGWFVTKSRVNEAEHDGYPCLYEAWVERREPDEEPVPFFLSG